MTRVIWMFSGQGSQYYGMGLALYHRDPVFRHYLDACDEIAAMTFGRGFIGPLFNSANARGREFSETSLTKPALFSIQYAMARALEDRGCQPDGILGYSLGEFVGLCLAKAMSVERTMATLAHLAVVLEQEIGPNGGGMTAVLADAGILGERPEVFQSCELAGTNSTGNFVIAGPLAKLQRCEAQMRTERMVFQRLPVEYAYHASALDPAKSRFIDDIPARFSSARIPVTLCSTTQAVTDPTADDLWNAVRRPVAFLERSSALAQDTSTVFFDLGPSGTLASALRPRLGSERVITSLSPFLSKPPDLAQIAARHHAVKAAYVDKETQRMES